MVRKRNVWQERTFFLLFIVFTFLCWCPLFYGSYGAVERIAGIPAWAALALIFGAILFVLEWIYLFVSPLAIDDTSLSETIDTIEKTDFTKINAALEEVH